MRVADGMKRPVEVRPPVSQEPLHLREIGSEVVILPDVGLQYGFEIGNTVQDVCSGEPVAIELTFQIR